MAGQDDREKRGRPRKTWENSIAEKMSHGMRQVRKCETGKNGPSLYVNKRNNI